MATYEKTQWRTNDPITADRMNKIENELARGAGEETTIYGAINGVSGRVTTAEGRIDTITGETIPGINGRLDNLDTNASSGANAWNAIQTATQNHTPRFESLNARLDDIAQKTSQADSKAQGALSEVEGAHRNSVMNDTLNLRFESVESLANGHTSSINTLIEVINNATNVSDRDLSLNEEDIDKLDERIKMIYNKIYNVTQEVIDARGTNRTALSQHFAAIDTELNDARLGWNSLDERLDAIDSTVSGASSIANRVSALETANTNISENYAGTVETVRDHEDRIGTLETDVNGAHGDYTSLDNRLDAIEENLGDISNALGEDYSSSSTVAEAIASAAESAETAAKSYADNTFVEKAKIYNGLDKDETGYVLDATQGKTLNDILMNSTTGLAATKVIADEALQKANAAATQTALSGIITRVETLEKSDTIIVSNATFNELGDPTNISNPLETADYLIKGEDDKYYYWRYISGKWFKISGGAGAGGNNSGYDFATEAAYATAAKEQNADYYVKREDGYHHYRYVLIEDTLTEIEIGSVVDQNNIKRYNMIKTETTDENNNILSYLDVYEFNYGEDTTINPDELPPVSKRIQHILLPQGGGGGNASTAITRFVRIPPTTITTIQNNDPVYIRFFYSCTDATGDIQEATYTLKDKNGIVLKSGDINSGDPTTVISGWPSDLNDGAIYDTGYGSIDVSKNCILGANTFYVTIEVKSTHETFTRNWTVNVLQLNIESRAAESALIHVGETIDIPYVPFGAMQKTLNVKVDNVLKDTVSLPSNITGNDQIYTLGSQDAGAHKIEMYLTATVNGVLQTSESIVRDYIWYDENSEIIIASEYRGKTIPVTQYAEVDIPYTVYKANSTSIEVEYYYDYDPEGENTPVGSVILNNINNDVLKYNANEEGPHTLTIKVDDTYITINIQVTQLNKDISPVPGAVIDFNPAVYTNHSTNRLPTWTAGGETYKLQVSDNFNWSDSPSGGGYKVKDDGACFVIKAGTYATLDYKMFKRHSVTVNDVPVITSGVFDDGAEMKLIFKVAAVRDASAIWFTNTGKSTAADDKEVGIQLSAHEGWLKTDKASDVADEDVELPAGYVAWVPGETYAVGDVVVYKAIIYQCITANSDTTWPKKKWQSLGQLETEISATNSYLYFPYSEEDKIELDININKQGNNEDFIMSYEDGVPSKAYPYSYATGGDVLYHIPGEESVIRIGSPDCDVYIYRLRIYNQGLTTDKILKNFIADGSTIDERIARYNKNSIYYDSSIVDKPEEEKFTPYASNTAKLDPYHLAERMRDVKILMLDTPRFTVGKKDFVKNSSLRCIQATGGTVYEGRADADNWFFQNGYHAGQGTTSDNYGQSARNVDFLFECDGDHAPTKPGNLSSNEWKEYVSSVVRGANASLYNEQTKTWSVAEGVTPEICTDWKGDQCKVTLTKTSVPNNYFNLKTNVASSENVNNALFQKRYNDFLPYTSPAKRRDSRIKNDMEFVPAVLFVRENDPDLSTHKEFNDTEWHFYALGNIGDSKKTDYTRAYDPDDMNEFTIEISDNNTANSQFQSGVFMSNGIATVETQAMADDPNIDQDPMKYIYPITSEQWNAVDGEGNYINYRHKTLINEPFDGDHSFEFRYACKGDYRDGDLINDTNGTIEVDGEEVSRDDLQFGVNQRVWYAFYEWIVTASKEQFRAEAEQWFVPEAVEFFYAFTHYYTMMDNRAKNTFWHFAKTGQHRKVSRPVEALLHVYDEYIDGEYVPTSDTTITSGKDYYTEYAFDLWVYDTDTACGIDNNGELSFPYGKEDKDYRVSGQASSGWAFNGSGSIFWRRLSDPSDEGGFANEIASLMRREDDNCFSVAQHLIDEFDNFQNCYPEEIWRLDIQRKYIRTFTGLSYDNSITTNKQNIRFLRAMMQGRKKYQRRQWVRNQAVYFGSKYGLNNVRTSDHTLEFNMYTPSTEDGVSTLAVPVDQSQLVIVPYQDMYIDVAVGNSTTNLNTQDFKRAKAGERVVVDCRSGGSAQETRVYIFGGEHIAAIENLAPMYTYSSEFGKGQRLKVLDLGSDNPNYNNPRFTSISINANMPLLETFSVKNCNRLAQAIDLSESNNLRVVEAEGSAITGISLPEYTAIETLHLPSTVSSVVLKSARELNSFYIKNKATGEEDYSNLITLNINDSDYSENVNWLNIANQTLSNKISWLYLQNLSTASIDNINYLQSFADKKLALETEYGEDGLLVKHVILSGRLNVTGPWGEKQLQDYQNTWPTLNIITDPTKKITQHRVIFKYDNTTHNGDMIYSMYVNGNNTLLVDPLPSQAALIDYVPEKPSSPQYIYTLGEYGVTGNYVELTGWRVENYSTDSNGKVIAANNTAGLSPITRDIILETNFIAEPRRYKVQWYLHENDSTPIYESDTYVQYGAGEEIIEPTVQDIVNNNGETVEVEQIGEYIINYKIFDGWQQTPPQAKDSLYKIYAKWNEGSVNLTELDETSKLTPEILLALSRSREYRQIVLTPYDQLPVTMGYSGPDTDTSTTFGFERHDALGLGYNVSSFRVKNSIQPFKDSSKPFTFVIDYCFNVDEITQLYGNNTNIQECILAGCEDTVSGTVQGFKLFYNCQSGKEGPCITFGATGDSQTVYIGDKETAKRRNIVVLRHPANSTNLYVYCYNDQYVNIRTGSYAHKGPILTLYDAQEDRSKQYITWGAGNTVNTEAPLVFGWNKDAVNIGTTPASSNYKEGHGTIYWAKYWPEDIGDGECRLIANWPHETITFGIEDYDGMTNRVVSDAVQQPPIVLTALTASASNKFAFVQYTESEVPYDSTLGWNNLKIRTYANNRFFTALPLTLQSIIIDTAVRHKVIKVVQGEYGMDSKKGQMLPDAAVSQDKIFLPSSRELGVDGNDYNEEAQKAFAWLTPANIQGRVWAYDTTTAATRSAGTANLKYLRLRFPYLIVPMDNTSPAIHLYPSTQSQSLYTVLMNKDNTVRRGDIMIPVDPSTNYAYIYVTGEDIAAGMQTVPNEGIFACQRGGWVKSEPYWLRSVFNGTTAVRSVVMMYITAQGDLPVGNSMPASMSDSLDAGNTLFSFSI